jgi:hypothetical protein
MLRESFFEPVLLEKDHQIPREECVKRHKRYTLNMPFLMTGNPPITFSGIKKVHASPLIGFMTLTSADDVVRAEQTY